MASIKKRPNGKWRARYRDADGKEHARHFGKKLDARRWLDEVTASVLTGQYVDPRAGRETFDAYAEQWREAKPHRPSTAKAVKQHLTRYAYPVFGKRRLSSITTSEVQSWATGLTKTHKLAPSTVRTVFNTVAAVFRAAAKDRKIARTPCEDIDLPPVPRKKIVPLTIEQVLRLADQMPDQYRALVIFGASTGLRPGELFGVEVRHINFFKRTLDVEQQVQQTAGHGVRVCELKTPTSYRTIPLPQIAIDALAAHLQAFPAELDGFVFTAPEGGPIVYNHFMDNVWRRAVKAADLPAGTGPHALRHAYASTLIAAGESVKAVSERLGHKNAAMTLNVYSHLFPDSEDRTRRAIDAAFQDHADSVRTEATPTVAPSQLRP
ncbi:Transposase [Nonomuraea coxensis DSM 45129]|uniref:Transposase n=1 Tax=Nonomuraea coxensis DSM 45129 TaxID=1122611 RepID=A0ABX8UB89_9ACTN|nr:site-specific integrase [Nonomuraea coxensis]QYC44947.1 Transposase [Nonomuraea coxensis DSM 45129]